MTDVVNTLISIAASVVVFISSCTLVIGLIDIAHDPIIKQRTDKTYIESPGVQDVTVIEITGRDILFSLINTDEMTTYPRAIRFKDSTTNRLTPVIKLDNEFLAYKMNNVAAIYSAGGQYKLSTLLDRKVIKQEYIFDDTSVNEGNPYLLFTF